MTAKPWMSTSLLVAAVTWGGVACACGTASLAAEPASVHAAHHGTTASPVRRTASASTVTGTAR